MIAVAYNVWINIDLESGHVCWIALGIAAIYCRSIDKLIRDRHG